MRITVGIDGKEMETALGAMADGSAPIDAMDAGAPASSLAAGDADAYAGGPPEWLLDAVGRAAPEASVTVVDETGAENAGPGPA